MLVEHVVAKREEKRALTQGTAYNQPQMYQAPAYGQNQGYNSNQGYGQAAEYYQNQSRGIGGKEGTRGDVEMRDERREQWVDEKKWNGESGDVNVGLVDEEVPPPRYSFVARS